jgi:hypothetical protein
MSRFQTNLEAVDAKVIFERRLLDDALQLIKHLLEVEATKVVESKVDHMPNRCLIDADAISYFKYQDRFNGLVDKPPNFEYIWNLLDGYVFVDGSHIVKLMKNDILNHAVFTGGASSDSYYLVILAWLADEIKSVKIAGTFMSYSRIIESYYLFKSEYQFDCICDIKVKSPHKLVNVRLTFDHSLAFLIQFRETVIIENGTEVFVYEPTSLNGKPVFEYPNMLCFPLEYWALLRYDPVYVQTEISYKGCFLNNAIRANIIHIDNMLIPIDYNKSYVFSRRSPDTLYSVINGSLNSNVKVKCQEYLSDLRGTPRGRKALEESRNRKIAFLLGTHREVGRLSSINRRVNGWFGEINVVKHIFDFLPQFD